MLIVYEISLLFEMRMGCGGTGSVGEGGERVAKMKLESDEFEMDREVSATKRRRRSGGRVGHGKRQRDKKEQAPGSVCPSEGRHARRPLAFPCDGFDSDG